MGGHVHPKTVVAARAATTTSPALCTLNDAFRRTGLGGRVLVTAGVAALPEATRAAILAAVRTFDRFDPDNDPYGEHDFGALSVCDLRVFWKIDALDGDCQFGSPDPTDAAVTVRVLTIMLAEEY